MRLALAAALGAVLSLAIAGVNSPPAHAEVLYNIYDLGALGGSFSFGCGINDSGQVTGCAGTSSGIAHAFLYSEGVMTDLGTLGGSTSYGCGINAAGQVVGYAYTDGGVQHAFLYSGGTMLDLNSLLDSGNPLNSGWTIQYAQGINDSGWITGYGMYKVSAGVSYTRAFLMEPLMEEPVPEPGTLALVALGLPLGLAWFKRRRTAQ